MSKWKQKLLFIYFFRSLWKTEWKLSFWADIFNDLLRVPGMVPGQPQRASLAPPLEQKEQQWNVPLWRLNFLFTFRRNGEPCRARRERVGRWVSVDTRPTLSHLFFAQREVCQDDVNSPAGNTTAQSNFIFIYFNMPFSFQNIIINNCFKKKKKRKNV